MDKSQNLKKLKAKILRDTSLPFKNTANNLVFGEGNPDTKILLLGESPGRNEDLTGKPFIGAAGKILNELLEIVGLNRKDVFVTSVLQYRPPKNRDPKPDEIKLFEPYIDQLIQIIKPKVVVTLGRFSLNKFLPNVKISQVHGQPHKIEWQGLHLTILPMYHPASVLYRRDLEKTLKEDILVLKQIG